MTNRQQPTLGCNVPHPGDYAAGVTEELGRAHRFDTRPLTAAELAARADAALQRRPFLVWHGPGGDQHLLVLVEGTSRVSIGRQPDSDIPIEWDPNVSRLHALLEAVGGQWTIVDDGLSRNGSYCNGQRLAGRQRLRDGDIITVGVTELLFRTPVDGGNSTAAGAPRPHIPVLTPTQRRVLISLCRPCLDPDARRSPSTNRQIAEEVYLSIDAVKFHLRALFVKFAVPDVAQNEKRMRLVDRAIAAGAARSDDETGH